MRALVAVRHSMLTAASNMLTIGDFYQDPGTVYFDGRHPAKTKARVCGEAEKYGNNAVSFSPKD